MRMRKDGNDQLGPIKIEENFEDHRYFQLAVLVDRPDFLREIVSLRVKWGLQNHLLPHDAGKRKEWEDVAFRMTPEEGQLALKSEMEFNDKYPDWFLPLSLEQAEQFDKDLETNQRHVKRLDFGWDIQTLRTRFKRPSSFDSAIEAALLYGEIGVADYQPCYAKVIYPEKEFPQHGDVPELAIVLDQFTRWEELKRIFDQSEAVKNELLGHSDLYKNLYDPA